MIRFYKYFLLSFTVLTTIVFPVSARGAAANIESKIDSAVQTSRAVEAKPKSRKKMNDSLIGRWSGKHITLEITANGAAVEYDCARGAIEKRIVPNKNREFEISGTYAEEHGGPVRLGERPDVVSVKYKGRIRGKKMILTVKRADDNEIIGTFSLTYGRESMLVKCL